MKLIYIIAVLACYAEARFLDQNCNGVIISNINHEKEILKSGIEQPYQLAIDYDTNTLFFSYSSIGVNTFESAYLNLKNEEFKIINGIGGGFANTVDEQKQIVYLGGRDGIYKFDYETKLATRIEGTNHNIWQLFFKKELYYTKYPEEEAYIFKNNESYRVPELLDTKAMLVAIDNNANIYFSNSSGLYIHDKSNNVISFIGEYNINGFTRDINGKLYFSTPEGLYYIEDITQTVRKLASIRDVYGVAVESDGNIIYASEDSVIRLKPTKSYCLFNDKENV